MTEDHTTRSARSRSPLVALASAGGRIIVDALVIGLWVLFLTLLFLSTGWPRWAFYLSLLLGVGLYVQFTAGWLGSSERES
ncbi:hypothetical protein CV102_02965 [Natronococcus pandeyae]|uniref:DUF8119 domain-containing protein n=1 Tax=Natronococcus pandeyae TaxID=2055836 RepID=A0A8J8QAI8_9EURY|nr:hypothetical protein [Natronococcus pandeyae]TYL40545.1 hypothetical protein CV102_02965 [Natronococcus pandeyae]